MFNRLKSVYKILNRISIALPLLLLFSVFMYLNVAQAQQSPTDIRPGVSIPADNGNDAKIVTNPAPTDADSKGTESAVRSKFSQQSSTPQAYITFKTPYEFWLTGLAITLVIVLGAMLCLMAALGALTPEFYKAFLILVVVFSALFLIVAGYTDQQTAPVFSLLGTIAGYIFGRSTSPGPVEKLSPEPRSPEKQKALQPEAAATQTQVTQP